MQIYVLDTEYEKVSYIDVAESVLWNKKHNDLGESEIYIPCDMEMLSILRKGYYLYRYDDDMVCQIEKVEIETDAENGNYIIATAKDMSKVLAGRIVRWNTAFSGKVVRFVKKLIEDNVINPKDDKKQTHTVRRIPNFVFDMTEEEMAEFTETINTTVNAEDLLQLIITTCKANNYGFRTSLDIDTKMLKFKLYKGVDRTIPTTDDYVEFSPVYGNIISSKYETDDSNYKNVAYVGYKSADKEDETMYLLSVHNEEIEPSGENRREVFVDGTSTSREISYEELVQMFPAVRKDGNEYSITVSNSKIIVATSDGSGEDEKITVTDYTYLLLIRTIGYDLLKNKTRAELFSGEVDVKNSYQYKIDYNIGDIVKVINEYGIEANAQIFEIMESEDNDNGHVVEPRFQYVS